MNDVQISVTDEIVMIKRRRERSKTFLLIPAEVCDYDIFLLQIIRVRWEVRCIVFADEQLVYHTHTPAHMILIETQ